MHLWSDYEGQTIAGNFPLEKLLSTEGRSASFLTHNGTGTAAVIRLTETLNDEEEMLQRLGMIANVKQENLLTVRKFGPTEFDGTPLVYTVMEPAQQNLADVLKERALTLEETKQIAVSLLAALQALHAHDLFHGHLEPASVLAVGDTVKLRSDCVRPLPPGPEGARAKAQDVRDFAATLFQALTQEPLYEPTGAEAGRLPAPFAGLVRNCLSGTWGLEQVAGVLPPPPPPAPIPAPPVAATAPARVPEQKPAGATAAAPVGAAAGIKSAASADSRQTPLRFDTEPVAPTRRGSPVEDQPSGSLNSLLQKKGMWMGGAAAAVLLLILGGHYLREDKAESSVRAQQAAAAPVSPGNATTDPSGSLSESGPVAAKPAPTSALRSAPSTRPEKNLDQVAVAHNPSPTPGIGAVSNNGDRAVWRVVAFTYNHEDQAQHKAATLASQHPNLNPEVFSPSGHAPYLVTLGGPMSREQAISLKNKARGRGLPRDLYAQNYSH